MEEDVADESIEEESDDVDENEEYDADADEESKRQQGLVVEARRLVVREEGRLLIARPCVLGRHCLKYQQRQGKGKDRDPVFVLVVACYC